MAEVVIPVTLFDTVGNMHLAEDGDLVAGLAKNVGEERNIGRQRNFEMLVGERAGRARVHAGERNCACRRAESIGAEGILKEHALAADAVVIGRFQNGIARDGQGVGTLAFAEEENQVRAPDTGLGEQCRWGDRRGKRGARHGERALQNLAARGAGVAGVRVQCVCVVD